MATPKYVILRAICFAFAALLLFSFPVMSEEEPARKLEYLPLYKYKNEPETALHILKENLAKIGIGEDRAVVTILPLEPNKLAVQAEPAVIEIIKTLMKNIDPPPPAPQQPPAKPQDLVTSFNVRYLHPKDLWRKVDEVMNNFLNFKKFDTGSDNMVVYARGEGNENRMNFFIPDFQTAEREFLFPKQSYVGYKIFVKATQNEKNYIDTLIEFIATIDKPLGDLKYETIPICYIEMKEVIKHLQAAGYNAVYTGDKIEATALQLIKSGITPVIYSAPAVTTESSRTSTQFSGSSGQIGGNQFQIIAYSNPTATTEIHNLIVYGSEQEIKAVKNYLSYIDIPAKQILIEAQIIEINIDDLNDIGLREVSGYDDLMQGTAKPSFPGESSGTTQGETSTFLKYDDSGASAGNFQASVAALVLEGKATIKARPKVTTIDGRQAIITIVRQVPVAEETINTNNNRSTFEISYIPVGITLNIKPRIGRANSEIQMQVNAVVSNVETINNVVSGLNIQAPELNTREVSTIVRIPNHQSLILGGLISTQTERRTYKVPILGDIPLLGKLFSRTKQSKDKTEIIIVLTPHIAEEVGDRTKEEHNEFNLNSEFLKPKDSAVLDSLDNLVNQSKYIIKYADIQGIDPLNRLPLSYSDERPLLGAVNDPVFLTVRNIVNKLGLANELGLVDDVIFPKDYPYPQTEDEKLIFAEAFLIDYIINANDLNLDNLMVGRMLLIPSYGLDSTEDFEGRKVKWHGENVYVTMDRDPLFRRIQDSVRKHYQKDGQDHNVERVLLDTTGGAEEVSSAAETK